MTELLCVNQNNPGSGILNALGFFSCWRLNRQKGVSWSSQGGIEPLLLLLRMQPCHLLKRSYVPHGAKIKKFLTECRNMRIKGEIFVNNDAKGCDLISDWRGGNVNNGDSGK